MPTNSIETSKVYGVSNDTIATYIQRPKVDQEFLKGLESNKHIIVYGASKQGKTSLTNKHLKTDDFVRIDCSPNSNPIDIYKSILRQLKIEFEEQRTETDTTELSPQAGIKAKVKIPFTAELELGSSVSGKAEKSSTTSYKTVEYNLSIAQDISEILKSANFNKRIILENFHYLEEEIQKSLAFDLRVFEDHHILFIILGIWREKNRLSQFNGDLLDRVKEVPVEPWEKEDFIRVIKEGEPLLNVSFEKIQNKLIEASFDSIGVLQELCKETCLAAGIDNTNQGTTIVFEERDLDVAIKKKLEDYSSRHIRCLETFIDQKAKSSEETPLYLAYYFIIVILKKEFSEITNGLKRKQIQENIQEIHHTPDRVRSSDLSNFLHNLVSSQIKKNIIPPLFDYDRSIRTIKVIDSTFYFFIKNINKDEFIKDLDAPEELELKK